MENFKEFSKKFERNHRKTKMKFEQKLSEFSTTILFNFTEIKTKNRKNCTMIL